MEHNHPFQDCRWIGPAKESQSPIICRRFTAAQGEKAEIAITGLGYFRAWLNGQPLTEERFLPNVSEYGPRDLSIFQYPLYDQLTFRIYYCTFDVSHLLVSGENTLTIQLGNGWYRQPERISEGRASYGDRLRAIYALTLTGNDGTRHICSDGSETWQHSPIVYNNLFLGEVHDYSRDAGDMQPVEILPEEPASLAPQIGPRDRIIRTIVPTLIREKDGVRTYDAGENISGTVRIHAPAAPGETLTLYFAENLDEAGELDFVSAGSRTITQSGPQIQKDICICGKEAVVFEPAFCWHAFRYFTVEGPGEDPIVQVIHSDVAVTGEFSCDSEGLTFLFDAYVRTQLNNMHGSIPSDCPHRERLGYTGDGQVAAAAAMMTLDTREFYRKWMRDILDTQDTVSGHVQHTAPLGGGGGGPVGWGGAIIVVPYRYFKAYNDLSLLEESWEPIRKWLRYLQTRMEDHLITREEPKGWCLGDWATLEETVIPEPFVNTCLLIRYLDMLVETAPLLNQEEDIPAILRLQNDCREAVKRTYFDPATGCFCGSVQGADAYGLLIGLGDERTKQNLIRRYTELGHFDTGFIGTDVLVEVLFSLNKGQLVHQLLSSEEMGSFLYMKRHGATTIWEHWNGQESHDHPMFGGCLRFLYEGFLGIHQAYGTGGYTQVTVTPFLPEGVNTMEGSILTPQGRLSVSLNRKSDTVQSNIQIPGKN